MWISVIVVIFEGGVEELVGVERGRGVDERSGGREEFTFGIFEVLLEGEGRANARKTKTIKESEKEDLLCFEEISIYLLQTFRGIHT
jgi:hypothetical protein